MVTDGAPKKYLLLLFAENHPLLSNLLKTLQEYRRQVI